MSDKCTKPVQSASSSPERRTQTIQKAIDRAVRHHSAGRLPEAERIYQQILQADPHQPVALHLLGVINHQRGENDVAVGLITKALAIAPDYAEAHNNLGNALRGLGKLDEAVASYHKALAIAPDFAEAHNNLGAALQDLGKLDEAVAAHHRALELKPDYAEAHNNLARSKTFKTGDPEIAVMEALATDSALDDDKKLFVFFALGKAHEDIGEYDRAFECFASGNRLKHRIVGFRIADEEKAAERLMAVFDETLFARLDGVGHATETPVFIVGMPRSGTSLIEQILASHPHVHGAGESPVLGRIVHELPGTYPAEPYPDCVSGIDGAGWRALGRAYMERLLGDAPAARRVTDKMPRNVELVGLIHLMLPNARVIHCIRDPLDTCLSCYTIRFEASQDFTYDLTDLGRYFRLYERLVDHWRRVLPAKLLDVRYEDVVDDLEGSARRLLDFCGLEWNDACLEFHKNDRIVRTASAIQVRQPIYRTSVERWRHYERHLGPLIEALGSGGES